MHEDLKFPLAQAQIQQILPHRYPFLLVDRVEEFIYHDRIIGTKNVSINEPYFSGHFPERPVMPGVLIVEALAQLGAIYAKLEYADRIANGSLIVFSGADKIRFRRLVLPGDVMKLELRNCQKKLGFYRMEGKATVEGEMAAEAVVMAAEIK